MRVNGDVRVRAKEIAKVLNSADSRIAAFGVSTAKGMMEAARVSTRGRNIFLAVTTALALVLAVIGVYGLTSYSTELRLREFGIRIALGASTPRLARTILVDLWWMAAIGIGVGFYAAGRLTDFLDTLYRMPWMRVPLVTLPVLPTVASAGTLILIAIVGTAVPLRRVMRLDVMRTLQGGGAT
jgi:ABC-type antimicrobial peptide transport system permease subunit